MAPLGDVLTEGGIAPEFHALLGELCSDDAEFLTDIQECDFEGAEDSNGVAITVEQAREVVRKLAGIVAAPTKAEAQTASSNQHVAKNFVPPPEHQGGCCVMLSSSVAAGGADAGLVRCSLSGELPKGKPRCKVLAVVLDRSGSMAGAMWNRVVEGVVSVVTDDLLEKDNVFISLLVYSDTAREVHLPATSSELRDLLLSRDFAPQGGTSFKAAFELTQQVLKRELGVCKAKGYCLGDVDLATLVFTDGEDTSVKMRALAMPEDAAEAEHEANEGIMQFQAFTGADERTAEFYIEGSVRYGVGLEEAVSHYFERGAAPPPGHWRPNGSARRPAAAAARGVRAAHDRPMIVDQESSSAAARSAGDKFRSALRATGCASHVCFAAFGSDHNPEQCQYLSDRYYYINRGEVLAEVLAGSLGALLTSAGQCALRLKMPPGITLDEQLLESLPLDSSGRLDHHVWLRVDGNQTAGGSVAVEVEMAGKIALEGRASIASTTAFVPDSFEDRLFLIDHTALQMRRVARELCGKRPNQKELAALRARLTEAKDRLQPTREAASVVVGQLRGRTALRHRLAEVEAARDRLSYALGQFDDSDQNDSRQIGTVAIDAILRDAGQHVPQGPDAAEAARRVHALATLSEPESLSKFGKDFTTDAYSCCDACELASQGDALFYQLGGVHLAPDGGFLSADLGCGLISHEAFVLLSRGGKQAVKSTGVEAGFTHLGLPLFATAGHFQRVQLLLPQVLCRLSPSGTYIPGVTERQLLSLLGRALAVTCQSEAGLTALVHMARAVREVLASTPTPAAPPGIAPDGSTTTVLDQVLAEAVQFLGEPESRANCRDLHAVAAAGLLQESWNNEAALERFGTAVVREALRRRVATALANAGEPQKLCLAWGLLGPVDDGAESKAWLEQTIPCFSAGELCLEDAGFNPVTAPDELEALEEMSPGRAAPRKVGAAALLSMLSSKKADSAPSPASWAHLRHQLMAWGRATHAIGSTGALWKALDAHMLLDNEVHQKVVQDFVIALQVSSVQARPCLNDAFSNAADIVVEVATSACLPHVQPGQCLRRVVAAALRAERERRAAAARAHPIISADFPGLQEHSAKVVSDIWGKPASPMDPALHHKAYLRVWRRTMNCRISTTTKEALADKEYRKRGGKFKFPSPLDTFIRGLHRRTADLHADWISRLNKETSGKEARDEAVAEMLLRLRWDDSDPNARVKLSQIVGRIWDGLEGVDVSAQLPISSALWLDDLEEAASATPARETTKTTSSMSEKAEEIKEALEKGRTPSPEVASVVSGVASAIALFEGRGKASKGKGKGKFGEDANVLKGKGKGKVDVEVESFRSKGKGKAGKKGGFRTVVIGAENARVAMDHGLQVTLDSLPTDLRRRMDAFAMRQHTRKVKLPVTLKAKQRKAIHLWAEMHGLGHQSFGYRGGRRLHLIAADESSGGDAHRTEEDDWS